MGGNLSVKTGMRSALVSLAAEGLEIDLVAE